MTDTNREALFREALRQIAAPASVPLEQLPPHDQPNGWRDIAVERIDIARAALSHTPQSVEPVATHVDALVEAAKAILHAVCHETGFAAAVRADSGLAYPWEPLDIAEAQLRQALAPFTKGQDDENA